MASIRITGQEVLRSLLLFHYYRQEVSYLGLWGIIGENEADSNPESKYVNQ